MSLLRRGIISSGKLGGVTPPFSGITGSMLGFSPTKFASVADTTLRLQGSTTMTVAFQIDVDTIVGSDTAIIGSWSSPPFAGWMIYVATNDFIFYINGAFTLACNFSSLTGFHNFAFVMDGSSMECFTDGVSISSDSNGTAIGNSSVNTKLNNYANSTSVADTYDVCGIQVFDEAKSVGDLFDGTDLIFRDGDPDMVFGITGLSGHDPLVDVSTNAMVVVTAGGLAADGNSGQLVPL